MQGTNVSGLRDVKMNNMYWVPLPENSPLQGPRAGYVIHGLAQVVAFKSRAGSGALGGCLCQILLFGEILGGGLQSHGIGA